MTHDEKTLQSTWGERIRTRREELGLTQRELADRARVSQSLVSGLERGAMGPSTRTQQVFAEALEIEVADLFPFPQVVVA